MKDEYIIEIDLKELPLFYNEFNEDELSLAIINYIDRGLAKTRGKEKITIRINPAFEVSEEQKEQRMRRAGYSSEGGASCQPAKRFCLKMKSGEDD